MNLFVRRHWMLGLSVLMLSSLSCGSRLVPDAELRAQFELHQAEFDTLASMVVADSALLTVSIFRATLGIYVRGTHSGDQLLTPEEIRATGRFEYGRLLGLVGFKSFTRYAGPSVWFPAHGNERSLKGLVYTQEPPAPLRETLDDLDRGQLPSTAYVRVAPGWYLFVQPKAE